MTVSRPRAFSKPSRHPSEPDCSARVVAVARRTWNHNPAPGERRPRTKSRPRAEHADTNRAGHRLQVRHRLECHPNTNPTTHDINLAYPSWKASVKSWPVVFGLERRPFSAREESHAQRGAQARARSSSRGPGSGMGLARRSVQRSVGLGIEAGRAGQGGQ